MRVVEDGGKCLTACNSSKEFNKSESSKAELGKSCAKLRDALNDLNESVIKTKQNPASALYQNEFLSKIKSLAPSAMDTMKQGNNAKPSIDNEECKANMDDSFLEFKMSLKDLVEQMKKIESMEGSLKSDATKELLDSLLPELEELDGAIKSSEFRPGAAQPDEMLMSNFISAKNNVLTTIQKINEALNSDPAKAEEVQNLILALGDNINNLVGILRNVATTEKEKEEALLLIDTAKG